MVDFDKLNRQTQEYRNRCVDRFNPSTKSNYNGYTFNYLNNQTYKANNNQYSKHYY